MNERHELHALLARCWEETQGSAPPPFWVRRTRVGNAEYSSNIVLAARATAEVARALQLCVAQAGAWPGRIEEANGFLNFHLDDQQLRERVACAAQEGARYGAGTALEGARINVEFVSAEPTGPLSLNAGRIAAEGEALCRLLEWQGAGVTREFFLNDVETSSKMRLLGESVEYYYLAAFDQPAEPPEGVMAAPWVQRVAQEIVAREGNAYLLAPAAERVSAFARQARDEAVREQKDTLRRFGVHFDVWTSESALRREGRVQNALARLRERGYLDERDGAQWLRSTAFGDEADRPLVRANGEPTYLAGDLAYHIFKFERGYDTVINIWTAPHETYVARTHAALRAAGYETQDRLEVLTCAGAQLLRDGTRAPQSTLDAGHELMLEEALREVDMGTLRFLFLLRRRDEEVAIDVEAARRDDEKNPAYAAQLLPARLTTLIGQAQANGAPTDETPTDEAEYSATARALAQLVALWPDEAATAAERREPWRVAQFVLEMAGAARELLNAGENAPLPLLRAAHAAASNALRLLGMEARDRF